MRNFTFYLAVALCALATKVHAQETFESKAKNIAEKIEKVTKDEKEALKVAVEAVNVKVDKGEINAQQAAAEKEALAKATAAKIESEVNRLNDELRTLVQDKVDGRIAASDTTKGNHTYIFSIKRKDLKGKKYEFNGERRTTSQFVFAIGLNNVVTDGSVEDSDFRYPGSRFYEWGLAYNTRIFKNDNLLHAKYGLSLMYNDLRPTNNRVFEKQGDQTVLVTSPVELKNARFRNVYLVAPVHLEFDFSKKEMKNDKTIFRTHNSFRLGVGGYAGLRIKSKQKTEYKLNDMEYESKVKGDFNASDFVYGLSTYIGYKQTSLYLKYDLNPLFQNNAVKQNNISLGVRFDFN
ncbi:hypothetical protein [Flavobacterium stagni]|uniref:Outer membrane protein beta-barrel domain-containing protein n=1 Tax=Flavobacterium stagni TaxID=2506421 RepID=A0A4Q1KB91_9FLAO|nr:hypothetical protein [Flavobacterium stagni]RXR23946.1 hypothetical protein EQG61_00465 [Flavobacterium stagni]